MSTTGSGSGSTSIDEPNGLTTKFLLLLFLSVDFAFLPKKVPRELEAIVGAVRALFLLCGILLLLRGGEGGGDGVLFSLLNNFILCLCVSCVLINACRNLPTQ